MTSISTVFRIPSFMRAAERRPAARRKCSSPLSYLSSEHGSFSRGKCGFMSGRAIVYLIKAGQKHRIPPAPVYRCIFVLFRVSGIQKPGLDGR